MAAQQEATAQAAGERLGKVDEHLDHIKETKQEIVSRISFERPDDPVLHAYAERVIERVIQKGSNPKA